MSLNFGKLDYSVSLNRTSAFPLDAKSYFESLEAAQAAANTAEYAGNTNTCYFYGQTVAVVENNIADLYIITPDKLLRKLSGETGTNSFYVGYRKAGDGEFYTDSSYTHQLEHNNKAIYADLNGTGFYRYTGTTTGYIKFGVADVPLATDEVAGIMKLYSVSGQNTDGTMTQKAITNGVKEIKFAIDDTESECLVLDLPW